MNWNKNCTRGFQDFNSVWFTIIWQRLHFHYSAVITIVGLSNISWEDCWTLCSFLEKTTWQRKSNKMGVSFLHAMIWLPNKSEMTIIYICSLVPPFYLAAFIMCLSCVRHCQAVGILNELSKILSQSLKNSQSGEGDRHVNK